ncbi:hypothetical protein [Streptomyces sp. NRRL S-1022]|uniref:hypothetical protein n=1 Tax=Streptomyces sp. NRRL S-1022 TaxID=1463880 RepID=UPI0004C0218A|nr:hypothetical protein [Streptomyces sp. NRRL S-1022]
MANATSPPQDDPPTTKMTLRIYRVNRYGTVTREYGTVSVAPLAGPPPFTSAFPPCGCPDCRSSEADPR